MDTSKKFQLRNSVKAPGVLLAATLLLSSCALLSSGGELSQECVNYIRSAAEEFREAMEPLSGDRIVIDSETSLTFPGLKNATDECQGENENEVASAYVIEFSSVANSLSSPFPQFALATLCQEILDDSDVGLTQEAYDICNESVTNAQENLTAFQDLLLDAENWVENGELPPSIGSGDSIFGPDGPAIGGVDTDISSPSNTSGPGDPTSPYELVYVVDGLGSATVSYTDANNNKIAEVVTLPWQYSATSTWDYNSLDAQLNGFGQISCAIYNDGAEMNKWTSSGESPKVFCFSR